MDFYLYNKVILISLIHKKENYNDRIEEKIKTEKEQIRIREIIGRNLLTMVVTFIILMMLLPVILRPLFESLWALAYDKDNLPYVDAESENAFGELISELIVTFAYPWLETMIRIVKFLFMLILVIIILYCVIHIFINIFMQTKMKVSYLMLMNTLSAIVTIGISFYFIPYTDAFYNFIDNLIQSQESESDLVSLPTRFIDILTVIWDYMLAFYQPVAIAVSSMFLLTTGLTIVFKNVILLDKNEEL